jgi:hypothetical protein
MISHLETTLSALISHSISKSSNSPASNVPASTSLRSSFSSSSVFLSARYKSALAMISSQVDSAHGGHSIGLIHQRSGHSTLLATLH